MGFIAEIESDPRLNLKMQIESRLTATKYKKRKANEGEDKDKEYEYDCAKCGVTRVVKGTKPKAGWDCGDGGYACKRRYKCKSCSRTIISISGRTTRRTSWSAETLAKRACPRRRRSGRISNVHFF